jgi:hypothetical protein
MTSGGGIILVGKRGKGKVYALIDWKSDYHTGSVGTIADGSS